jgi:two-component system, OmpR family, aerobic respiration control sensor histidine kinase ArcB
MSSEIEDLPDLKEIIALMPGNIYWKNRHGTYLGCNENALKLVKLSNRADLIGKTLYDIAPKSIADAISGFDEEIMNSGLEASFEELAHNIDGSPATYFTRKVPLKNKDGSVVGLVGISIDISERVEHERAIKIAKEKAEVASKAKSVFIMNMSHDIRTPFSGILGLSKYLCDKEDDLKKKDILQSIADATENLLDILNEVIMLASCEDTAAIALSTFNLSDLVTGIYKAMLPATQHKGLRFKFLIDPSLPTRIQGDEYAMKRILLNLVGNAIKFTDQGEVRIVLSLKEKIDDTYTIELKVFDTGIGISKEKQGVIFEQFSKLNTSYQGQCQGTGLGLWFVKQLVQRMGGEVQVDSSPGMGASFICTFSVKS